MLHLEGRSIGLGSPTHNTNSSKTGDAVMPLTSERCEVTSYLIPSQPEFRNDPSFPGKAATGESSNSAIRSDMSETPPEHIEKMDWRIQNLTWTTAPFTNPATGTVVPAEAPIVSVALIRHGKERLGAAIPNASAMFLNLSHTFHDEAGRC
jgi:hypothetical protein